MSTPDYFRSRLDQMIDMRHPLAVLASRLPWAASVAPLLARQERVAKRVISQDLLGVVEQEVGAGFSAAGRPRLPCDATQIGRFRRLLVERRAGRRVACLVLRRGLQHSLAAAGHCPRGLAAAFLGPRTLHRDHRKWHGVNVPGSGVSS